MTITTLRGFTLCGVGRVVELHPPLAEFVPTKEVIGTLAVGGMVQLGFVVKRDTIVLGWVTIRDRCNDLYIGEFANEQMFFSTLKKGDRVAFGAQNVVRIGVPVPQAD